jgi:hypothetical protein
MSYQAIKRFEYKYFADADQSLDDVVKEIIDRQFFQCCQSDDNKERDLRIKDSIRNKKHKKLKKLLDQEGVLYRRRKPEPESDDSDEDCGSLFVN